MNTLLGLGVVWTI